MGEPTYLLEYSEVPLPLPSFRSRECKAFFISLLGQCHMITNAYANKTEDQFGTTYFKKVSDNLL